MKNDNHTGDVSIYLAGAGIFLAIVSGVFFFGYKTIDSQLSKQNTELQYTVEQAITAYADTYASEALARAEEAAARAEAAAQAAEESAAEAEGIVKGNDTAKVEEPVTEVAISDLIDFDETKVSAEFIEITEDNQVVYIVQSGDTLCKISGAFYVSVDELVKENHIIDARWIYTGESIRIPTAKELAEMD